MAGLTPGAASPERPPLLNIKSGASPPPDAYVAIQYKERWFWIGEDDIRSKSIFTSVMLLFSHLRRRRAHGAAGRHRARQLTIWKDLVDFG